MVVAAICLESSEATSFREDDSTRIIRPMIPELRATESFWSLMKALQQPSDNCLIPCFFISLVLLTTLKANLKREYFFSEKMDNWIVSQISFWFTVRKVKPAQVVDQIINFWLDVTVPGRGTGENNWVMRGVRSVQQGAERTQAELDIRSNLNRWDKDYPEIHHELLVRWGCGLVASLIVSSLYQALKPQSRNRKY